MRSELTVGDVITSIGGIIGTICAVKENTIVIESGADRVRIELAKWAVRIQKSTGDSKRDQEQDPHSRQKSYSSSQQDWPPVRNPRASLP